MSQIYMVNFTAIKKIKLLGILFRFVPISTIAKYFFWQQKKKKILYKCVFYSYLLKRGTTWNDVKRPKTTYNEQETIWNKLKRPATSKKRPETTYNKQEMTWNDLQRTRNNMKRPGTA